MEKYKSITQDEIKVGMKAEKSKRVTEEDVTLFAEVTGDKNPAHVDEEYAKGTMFKTRIAHGMLGSGLISAVLGMELPGPGTIYLGQELKFVNPIKFDDVISAKIIVREILDKKKFKIAIMDTVVVNQDGQTVIEGTAKVIPPR
ncbi:MaoC family dehydratase [Clostridium niameyense]|uniref:MaoC family dehydratase n=1 Tax=Clostridium niameyense TaxID=1622073 RepID=A0A6M0R9C3_9CLOT|nr:MaoC family dehydratase [Clostridium niameyense]NEZ46250.1 MaoC family dehydratase [Clostridium niameyense]